MGRSPKGVPESAAIQAGSGAFDLRAAWRLFRRPQPVTAAMVALAVVIPLYLVIGARVASGRSLHEPALWLDRTWPIRAEWSSAYVSLFLAALLPAFVVHQVELLRRTVNAFLATWLAAYAVFLAWPTAGPQLPEQLAGTGFSTWLLKAIHASDVPYNCLPSLHVAQCVLAALACGRVHRGVGVAALLWAGLVGLSTLYTRQHYVLDVISGAALGCASYGLFVRGFPRSAVPVNERRLAPLLAGCAVGVYGLLLATLWVAYLNGVVA